MKVIIAGSRTFNDYELLRAECNLLLCLMSNVEIVSGGANGADRLGEKYANEYNYKLTIMKADWKKFGKSAGYRRNEEMAKYADSCICFWDGLSKGTKHMIDLATKYGLITLVVDFTTIPPLPPRYNLINAKLPLP